MGVKIWNGSAFVDGTPAKANASNVPTEGKIWNGSAYVKIWPTILPISYVNSNKAGTAVVALPPGAAAGDFLIAVAGRAASAVISTAFTWPAGWSVKFALNNPSGASIYYRIEIATMIYSSGASWTFTTGTLPLGNICAAYRGVASANLAAETDGANSGSGSNYTTPAVVNPSAENWRIAAFANSNSTSIAWTACTAAGATPTTMSIRQNQLCGSGVNNCNIMLADSNAKITAASTTVTGTCGTTTGRGGWIGCLDAA